MIGNFTIYTYRVTNIERGLPMGLWCDWLLLRWRNDPATKTVRKKTGKETKRRNKTRMHLNKFSEYFAGLLTLGEGPGDHVQALVNFISSK